MKKSISTAFIVILALSVLFLGAIIALPQRGAEAAETHKVVIAPVSNLRGNEYAGRSTVALHVKDSTSPLVFYIPESYYLSNPRQHRLPDLFVVSYADADFEVDAKFVKTDTANFIQDVTFADDELALFPSVALTVKEGSTVVVDGVSVGHDTQHLVKFLGYNEYATQYYVSVSKMDMSVAVYGFIPAESVEAFNVPYQTKTQKERDAMLAEDAMPKPENGDIVPNTSLALRIVIILGICIPAVLIVVMLFKPGKKRAKQFNSRAESDYDKGRKS